MEAHLSDFGQMKLNLGNQQKKVKFESAKEVVIGHLSSSDDELVIHEVVNDVQIV